MAEQIAQAQEPRGLGGLLVTNVGRIAVSLVVPALTFLIMRWGFVFLRDSDAPPLVIAAVAVILGVGGVAVLFVVMNFVVEQLPDRGRDLLRPYVFVGPAIAILFYYLALPAIRTFLFSLDIQNPTAGTGWFDLVFVIGILAVAVSAIITNLYVRRMPSYRQVRWATARFLIPVAVLVVWYLLIPTLESLLGTEGGASSIIQNYHFVFADPIMREAMRNNALWMFFGTGLIVVLGLFVAILADRSSWERTAKAFIFLPMAISFVGAGVIFRFIYDASRAPGQSQIGMLNAIREGLFNAERIGWLQMEPWNNFMLIAVLIFLQTGFAMVLISSALKGVPDELLEAGRIDGASERQIFFRIIIPYIRGTLITVSTTIVILTLKIFDIIFVMTQGRNGTEVFANRMYNEMFRFANNGHAGAIATVLLLLTTPVMYYNLRRFREEEAF